MIDLVGGYLKAVVGGSVIIKKPMICGHKAVDPSQFIHASFPSKVQVPMYFLYSPQRDSNRRVEYQFEPSKKRITIICRSGRELAERLKDGYGIRFHEEHQEKYVWNFNSPEENDESLPEGLLTDQKIVDGELHVKLLKPYGPEEEHNLALKYPDWNRVDNDASECALSLKTSLSEFDKLVLSWSEQISEIKAQTHNMLCYLNGEYKNLNSNNPPFSSPISIRSLKTSVFINSVLYIEAVANFLSALAVNIDDQVSGSPTKIFSLCSEDIKKLNEIDGNYLRLEDKLVFSLSCISRIVGVEVKIDKGNHVWGRFKEFKKKRDSLTHVKVKENSVFSLGEMVGAVKISDNDLFLSMELICWINEVLNNVFRSFDVKIFSASNNFNDILVGYMIDLAADISGNSSKGVHKNYEIDRITF